MAHSHYSPFFPRLLPSEESLRASGPPLPGDSPHEMTCFWEVTRPCPLSPPWDNSDSVRPSSLQGSLKPG